MGMTTRGDGFRVTSIKFRGGAGIVAFTGTINTSTTFANTDRALPGTLLIDRTGKKLYINTGTKASPTWTVVGTQS
jgi:hypothetical protein